MTQNNNNLPQNQSGNHDNDEDNIFFDLEYLCKSTQIINDALRNGLDVAQLSNGEIIVTETKTINTQYNWDNQKKKMMRAGHGGATIND
jgi:hypothetical protein